MCVGGGVGLKAEAGIRNVNGPFENGSAEIDEGLDTVSCVFGGDKEEEEEEEKRKEIELRRKRAKWRY